MPFGPKGLVVTWSIPVPEDARVTYSGPEVFSAVDRVMGAEIPPGFPRKYLVKLAHVDLFNAHMSWSAEELKKWESRQAVEMQAEPLSIFQKYFDEKHVIASTLIAHPPVSQPEKFKDACSIVLQRAVIVSNPDPGMETLFLRSYFHSVDTSGNGANFVPVGGVRIEFPSKSVWFPLELTRVISEPAAYIVIDVLSPGTLDTRGLLDEMKVVKQSKMQFQGKTYQVTRITGRLQTGRKWKDLSIGP